MDVHRSADATGDYRWEPASHGQIPAGAVPHGYEEDGRPIWVCRAKLHGGIHPGKVHPGLGQAGVTWAGGEFGVPEYEVLMERGVWAVARGGEVPPDAYPAGRESNGETLFVARAAVGGRNLHPGKVRPAFGAANIGYGNQEHRVYAYEVLLLPERRPAARDAAAPVATIPAAGSTATASVAVSSGSGSGRITVTVIVDLGNAGQRV